MPRRRSFGYIRRLPSGHFQASYIAPNGHRRTAPQTFSNKTDAGEWLTRIQVSILDGRWRDPVLGRQLLTDYATTWIDQRPGLRPRTVDLYRWLLKRHIEPHFGRITLDDLTPMAVRRWRSALLADGVSETMAAKSYRLLRAVLNTAVDDDIVERNPCRIKGGGDEDPKERPTLTVEQVQALAMLMPPRFSAFVMVAVYGCLRWGEITALTRNDVDLDAGTVSVRFAYIERSDGTLELGPPKSRASRRTVALPQPVVELLRSHISHYVADDPDALIFTGPTGRPLRRSNFNKLVGWTEARATLGVPHLHVHDLRHTGNTLAAGTPGTSTRDLMERMGHDSMRAALIYQHATRDAGRRIADSLQAEIERRESSANRQDVARRSTTPGRRADRSSSTTPRRPKIRGLQVPSSESAGVVQWQNISFPS
jgi:integrase